MYTRLCHNWNAVLEQNQVLVALVGPAVFYGSFYPHVSGVDVRFEHLITGPRLQQVRFSTLAWALRLRVVDSRAGSSRVSSDVELHVDTLYI